MFNKINRYIHTIKYLKPRQIWYRVYYRLRNKIKTGTKSSNQPINVLKDYEWVASIVFYTVFEPPYKFNFLNREKVFNDSVEWNFSQFGKLWVYNLNYFEYLHQAHMDLATGKSLIYDFIQKETEIKDGSEPFPTSLRLINWIKFILQHHISDSVIDQSIYRQANRLGDHIEYHLMGNHLLENGFALFFAANYINDEKLYHKASKILKTQLEEQILEDGGHFELSAMYHQHMLYRVLDCYNLARNKNVQGAGLADFLRIRACKMLGWLSKMTFDNGDIPLVNDSARMIAPTTRQILAYASRLGLMADDIQLSTSGYRKISTPEYQCIVDVGNIGPDYIPGHAHSDTFSFVLYHKGEPIIIDPGISTYDIGDRRQKERSTANHNTVQLGNLEQSEIWAGFRVARRAKAFLIKDDPTEIEAWHNGYLRYGFLHTRRWNFLEKEIEIKDSIDFLHPEKIEKNAFFHFFPGVVIKQTTANSISVNGLQISFETAEDIRMEEYFFTPEFNKLIPAVKISVRFDRELTTTITM